MKPFQSAIVCDLIASYKREQAFHNYFASVAKQHRNWGSKDRKTYRNACYAYFRLGFAKSDLNIPERLEFAMNQIGNDFEDIKPEDIFPFKEFISEEIEFEKWAISHLKQKPIYLILRKGFEEFCHTYLKQKEISFEDLGNNCLRLPHDSKCDELTDAGKAWVMDWASAQAADAIEIGEKETVWDACAGAGGKSLYIRQKFGNQLNLTCSDKRFSILENLKSRFLKLNYQLPSIELTDLIEPFQLPNKYDVIILDVPCSGSGTWGRTPENLTGFDVEMPDRYAKIQKKIVSNALRNLKPGGRMYYLTCSVFKKENEENTEHFKINHGLNVLKSSYIHGEFDQTDTLYLSEFLKPV